MPKLKEVSIDLTIFGRGRSRVRVYRMVFDGPRGGRLSLNVIADTAASAKSKISRKLRLGKSRFTATLIIEKGQFMPRGFSAARL
ncbi:hypothetical protein LCGC14_0998770 [marine sediment metagenome]|uniref:Uncharacterized protein n=1 Tax=marine sediment metagenome TaxID=412755 RepID=A0A0F9R9T6_9ZZZZ